MAIQEEKTPAFKIDLSEQAQRLLKDRPSFSIMTRLTLGFILWIVLSLGTVIVSIYVTSEIEKKLYFMESSDIYSFEIQQARRFEKNYFLYHTNLNDALSHVRKARQILEKGNKNFLRVLGEEECGRIQDHLSRYESLLSSLENSLTDEQQNEIEIELREHGSDMVTMAKELVAEERNTINSLLVVSKRIPIIFRIIL
ncbi:MAG: hypothetical protein HN597_20015, partial [Desulfobacula sp.]|nr:hypothetical protein [Desulfobacula sp.]